MSSCSCAIQRHCASLVAVVCFSFRGISSFAREGQASAALALGTLNMASCHSNASNIDHTHVPCTSMLVLAKPQQGEVTLFTTNAGDATYDGTCDIMCVQGLQLRATARAAIRRRFGHAAMWLHLIFSKQQGCQERGRRAAASRPRLHHAPCTVMTCPHLGNALPASAAVAKLRNKHVRMKYAVSV